MSVPISQIIFAAAAMAGEVVSPESGSFQLDADTLTRATSRLNIHLPTVWNAARWPETTETEQWRLYSAPYWTDDLRRTLTAEQKAIDPTGAGIYVSLVTVQAAPGDDPWPAVPLSDATKWFQLRAQYSGLDDWSKFASYVRGDVVRFQKADSAGRYAVGAYVCKTPTTAGIEPPSPVPSKFPITSAYWIRVDTLPLVFTPPATFGELLEVSETPPDGGQIPVSYSVTRLGVRVSNGRAENWFTYRKKAPALFGASWSESIDYPLGAQVWYFDETTGTGDFFTLTVANRLGFSPGYDPISWERVEIPDRFLPWLSSVLAADWLRWDGNEEKARLQDVQVMGAWDELLIRWERDQKQLQRMRVRK